MKRDIDTKKEEKKTENKKQKKRQHIYRMKHT